jgi:hypothetical protein
LLEVIGVSHNCFRKKNKILIGNSSIKDDGEVIIDNKKEK